MPDELKNKIGITDTLLRFSTGIEASEDIVSDLKQALDSSL